MLTGGAHSSQRVLVGLQLQAVVAQECCCGCSPLPGRPGAVPTGCLWDRDSGSFYLLAWHQSCCWAGEPQMCMCTEASLGAKWHQWHSPISGTVLGGSCSCGAEQPQGSGTLPAPAATPAGVSWGTECGTRCQAGLAFPTRKISIGGRASPVFLLEAVHLSWTEKENSCA